MAINNLIKFRRGLSSEWTSANPILASGEPGFEVDTGRLKLGNGSTAWNSLYYESVVPTGFIAGTGISIDLGANGATATINAGAATEVNVYVKNTTGGNLTKGQAVYINGAQGDNPTIALAIASGEATSSKTLGLLKQNLTVNEFGYVISEGILEGIDTNGASAAGDAIWLSPTVSGGVLYGLANKPYAPNHLVFIGYVLRKQQNNGKIYIKPQNGFELQELHNVAVTGATDGQFLQYNSGSGLWIPSSSGSFTTISSNDGIIDNLTVNNTANMAYFGPGYGVDLGDYGLSIDSNGNIKSYDTISAGFNGQNYNISIDGNGGVTGGASISIAGLISATSGSIANSLSVSGTTINNSGIVSSDPFTIQTSTTSIIFNDYTLFSQNTINTPDLILDNQTGDTVIVLDNNKKIVSLNSPTTTELSYISGISSNIQSQLNSKQSTLTNPVTGIGVSNHIAYWNSSSGISYDSNQLVWDDANNRVGIGTLTPLQKLHVSGDINVDSNFGYRINNTATSGQYLRGDGTRFSSSSIQVNDVPTLNQNTTGSAATLTTSRTLWGQSFNGSASISGDISGAGNISSSGRLTTTLANDTNNGGGQIYLNGATGNRIDFNSNGAASPSLTTRSAGTKIVLFPQVNASNTDYGIGIEAGALWNSVPSTSQSFKWYGGTTNIATLSAAGNFTINGVNGKIGVGTGSPTHQLHIVGSGIISSGLAVSGNLTINGTDVSVSGHTHTSSNITDFGGAVSGLLPTISNSGDNRVLTSTGSSLGINAEANLTFDGTNLSAPYLLATYASGDEGGEIQLTKPPNGTLNGGITIDAYQNKLRFFEQGGSARGFYLDISAGGAGVGTNLAGGGSATTVSNYGDNRIITSDGTTTGLNAESNFTFNGSLLTITGSGSISSGLFLTDQTASTIASFDSNKKISSLSTSTYPSLTELSYVKGVTSSIQTQLDNKQSTLTNPVTGSGIANHVAYWSSSSGIVADSGQLYWDSSNDRLGVGTSSPTARLHVIGSGIFSSGIYAGNISATGNVIANTSTNGSIVLSSNGTGALQRGSGGNTRGQYAVDWQNVRSTPTMVAAGYYSVIGGGLNNTVSGNNSIVGGGTSNTASGYCSTVGGGYNNTASAYRSTVGGGHTNTASSYCSTVGGGQNNTASNERSTVGGGYGNTASGSYGSTVAGGYSNTASGYSSTVSGGHTNTASNSRSTVGGGQSNTASGDRSIVGGGQSNTSSGYCSTVGGGLNNTSSGYNVSTVGGGQSNTASGDRSTVGGGQSNTASGYASSIMGGIEAVAHQRGEEARSSGKFSENGDAQVKTLILRGVTSLTNNTVNLTFNGALNTTVDNDAIISHHRYDPNNTAKQYSWYYTIKVIGRSISSAVPESAAYKFEGILESSAANGVILLGNTKTVIYEDNADWDCNIYEYNTNSAAKNDGLYIECLNTLSIDEDIYWVAHVEIVEVGITEAENPAY